MRGWGYGVVAMLLLAGLMVVAVACRSEEPEAVSATAVNSPTPETDAVATPAPTVGATPTATVAPTAIRQPTATPTPEPTATGVATPIPTNTPVPPATPDAATYADLDLRDSLGRTLLHNAARDGDIIRVEALIAAGADTHARGNMAATPLHMAAEAGHEYGRGETAKALIDAGADVNAVDIEGYTPLHLAIRNGHTGVTKALLASGAETSISSEYGYTPLHETARAFTAIAESAQLLTAAGADVNATDIDGRTPLHTMLQPLTHRYLPLTFRLDQIPALRADVEMAVLALVAAGADVSIRDPQGETALFYAVDWGISGDTLKAMVDAGADINARNNRDVPLVVAAIWSINEDATLTLLDAGATLDYPEILEDMLWRVVLHNGSKLVAPLVAAGADVNKIGVAFHSPPLKMAAQEGHTETVLALIVAGAGVNWSNEAGYTALHIAAQNGHTETVLALIAAGADASLQTVDGETAADLAAEHGHDELAQLLR